MSYVARILSVAPLVISAAAGAPAEQAAAERLNESFLSSPVLRLMAFMNT